MPTFLGLTIFLQAEPLSPAEGSSWGIWYIVVAAAAVAFVGFWILKRISDIAAQRKTAAMIREVGEEKPQSAESSAEDDT